MLLSYRLWQTQFGGDPGIVGRQVLLDAESFTVIGVMPQEFRFPSSEVLYWTPLRFNAQMYVDRNDNWHYSVGRLRAGVTFEQAQAEMDVLAARSKQQFPAENKDVGRGPDPPRGRRRVAAGEAAAATRSPARPPACC